MVGTATANAQAPGGDRGDRPADHAADRAGRDPAGRAVAADAQRRPADAARPRAGDLAAPRAEGAVAAGRGLAARLPRHPRRGRVHRDPDAEVRGVGDRVAAPTSSRSTTSAGRRTSRRARSSTSSRWSASSSGSTRSARCSGPSRTTPCGTSPSTSPSTSSSASSSDHRDVLAVLRDVIAGMVAGGARARRGGGRADRRGRPGGARRDPGAPLPRRAGAGRRARGRARPRAGARARARRVGAGRARQRLRRGRGLPDGQAALLHPSRSRTTPAGRTASTCIFRGLELVTGGQRLHRPSDYDAAIRANGEDPEAYAAYLQAFRHGMPPHGGFAIGLERWTSRLTGAANVREVTLFPRDLNRLTP